MKRSETDRIKIGKRMARENPRINVQSIRERKAFDSFATKYSNLSKTKKRFINEKAYMLIEQGVTE